MQSPPNSLEPAESAGETTRRQTAGQAIEQFLYAFFRVLLALILVFVLFLLLIPTSGARVQVKGLQTRALAQAMQIGRALKFYADDHDGNYPAGVNDYGEPIVSSNDAFRSLFPTYTHSEVIFGNKLSAYQKGSPDNVVAPPREILRPGENVYSYVMGATDKMPGNTPLVVDGTDGSGLGTYVSDPQLRGGVWSGTRVVLVRLDCSCTLATLSGPGEVRYVVQVAPDGTKRNLLSPAALGPDLKLLDPAVAPPGER